MFPTLAAGVCGRCSPTFRKHQIGKFVYVCISCYNKAHIGEIINIYCRILAKIQAVFLDLEQVSFPKVDFSLIIMRNQLAEKIFAQYQAIQVVLDL